MRRHAIHLGAAWQPPVAAGQAWIRRFGRPTGVGPGDRVLLVWDPPGTLVPEAVRLNGDAITTDPEVDVTALLRDRNELALAADRTTSVEAAPGLVPLPAAWGRPALVIVTTD